MEETSKNILAQMRPDIVSPESGKWQQRKAAETRVRILDAAIDCLVEKGYARLSTNDVAQRAGVSRGAMHHHFANRMALVAAAIEYTFYKRMRFFLDAYRTADDIESAEQSVAAASRFHWRSVQTREYAAYLELAVAARTDPELNAAFEPASHRYDEIWSRDVFPAFPHWRDRHDALRLANDFAVAAHMGLLVHLPILERSNRAAAVRALIAEVIRQLQAGTIDVRIQSELPSSTLNSRPAHPSDAG
jgi:AcrR family transcriptional regulator